MPMVINKVVETLKAEDLKSDIIFLKESKEIGGAFKSKTGHKYIMFLF